MGSFPFLAHGVVVLVRVDGYIPRDVPELHNIFSLWNHDFESRLSERLVETIFAGLRLGHHHHVDEHRFGGLFEVVLPRIVNFHFLRVLHSHDLLARQGAQVPGRLNYVAIR